MVSSLLIITIRVVHPRADKNKMTSSSSRFFAFGPKIKIPLQHAFVETRLSLGFVNLKPVVPGHVLICPKRVVEKYDECTDEEISDFMQLSKRVGVVLKRAFDASSLTLTVQDGKEAGQTVPHVHVHVMPRKVGDFERNDDVYEAIEKAGEHEGERKACVDAEEDRVARTSEVMEKEAQWLRSMLKGRSGM